MTSNEQQKNNEIVPIKSTSFAVTNYKKRDKKDTYKTPEELKLLPENSASYNKIVDVFKNIDSTIEKGDETCKKVLDNHEKQFLLAYRVFY